MTRPKITFIADSLDNAYLFQVVLSELNAEITAGSTLQISNYLRQGRKHDLVIFESRNTSRTFLEEVESLAENQHFPLLLIVDAADIAELRLPKLIPCDFVVHGATKEECTVRVLRLLGHQTATPLANMLTVGSMTINLDSYQVNVGDDPIDFTYLEYALLAFLVQHPNRTFSREVLLQRVWGIEYFGGSRTVDVHVRRIRSKLGPNLAQHLETVRNVGYLWNSD